MGYQDPHQVLLFLLDQSAHMLLVHQGISFVPEDCQAMS
jgi:hypothetical protein